VLRDSNPGFTWGSYGYIAPEQVNQQPVGPAADVYAATLVLWELLAGRKAIDRGTMSDADVLADMAAPKIPLLETMRTDLDRRLFDAVRTGLEVDPARRTLTAASMRDLLVGLVDMGTEQKRLATMLEPVRTSTERARQPSRPVIAPAKPAPPRPVAKSIPPVHTAPKKAPQPEPDPFKAAVAPLPAPPPAPVRPPPPPPAAPVSMKATLMGIMAPPPPPAPSAPVPPLSPISPPPASPEPVAQMYAADALELEPIPLRRRSPLPMAVGVAAATALAIVGVVLFVRSGNPSPAAVAVAPSSIAPTPSPAPIHPPEPIVPAVATATTSAPAASAPTAAPEVAAPVPTEAPSAQVPPDQGQLVFPPSAAGHRIFVDGRVVGDGAQPATVRCGPHDVKIGSAGTPQRVDVPCGGSVTLTH
jgi:hypothetical protein